MPRVKIIDEHKRDVHQPSYVWDVAYCKRKGRNYCTVICSRGGDVTYQRYGGWEEQKV